ncbi:MAG TPA: GDSL-type esterase/lipase family protein [Jiangellaceae bacterium]|nr:GDSL-type esterase/lipase family protein [Jiangellaceae bacterium]
MRDVRVCVFGDSFVVGIGDPTALGWVGRVAVRTPEALNVHLTMYPLGVRGESTEEIVVRIPLESAARFARGDQHGIVIAAGIADAYRGLPAARSAAALDFGLGSSDVSTLVVGPPPLGDAALTARIAAVDEAFRDVCNGRGVPYISTYERLIRRPSWQRAKAADGIHPDRAGYAMLSRIVLDGGWSSWLDMLSPEHAGKEDRAR